MILKVFVIALVACPAVFAFDSKQTTQEILDKWETKILESLPECLQSSGVTQEEVDNFFHLQVRAASVNLKCFIRCFQKGFKFLNDDEAFNKVEIVNDIAKATEEMVDFCIKDAANIANPCDRSYRLADCLLHYAHIYV
ncbi:uncharacterized protein LOC116180125 [Photinus pyralis]|uniref:uncharacterized protein LOC116180125 n=1 Tax=Photinus pyralis TaxID=7054 RepID=UPI0012671761|nr:uncharacterized protein LOC116180125 [Photinus pyralis]